MNTYEEKNALLLEEFKAIASIPRGSYNTKAISDYCKDVAKQAGAEVYQDALNNLIITIPPSPGYETSSPVILQGHLDMVCEKTPDSEHDFLKDGITLIFDGDWLHADNTTLGADNGVAIAMGLALLKDPSALHPKVYLVFTTEEEVGMEGALGIDLSPAQDATMLINLDSGEEGVFITGCAGSVALKFSLPFVRTEAQGLHLQLEVSGLTGGHSGLEIHHQGANASILTATVLSLLKTPYHLISINGGTKDNVITTEALAELVIQPKDLSAFQEEVQSLEKSMQALYTTRDPDLKFDLKILEEGRFAVLPQEDAKRLAFFTTHAPNGVQKMNASIPGMVDTSLNLGITKTEADRVLWHYHPRFSQSVEKDALIQKMQNLADYLGIEDEVLGCSPGWAYREDSTLRNLMTEVYQNLFDITPQITTIHAGLECGILLQKLPHLNCISIGPDMEAIHSAKERLHLPSFYRTYHFLRKTLEALR